MIALPALWYVLCQTQASHGSVLVQGSSNNVNNTNIAHVTFEQCNGCIRSLILQVIGSPYQSPSNVASTRRSAVRPWIVDQPIIFVSTDNVFSYPGTIEFRGSGKFEIHNGGRLTVRARRIVDRRTEAGSLTIDGRGADVGANDRPARKLTPCPAENGTCSDWKSQSPGEFDDAKADAIKQHPSLAQNVGTPGDTGRDSTGAKIVIEAHDVVGFLRIDVAGGKPGLGGPGGRGRHLCDQDCGPGQTHDYPSGADGPPGRAIDGEVTIRSDSRPTVKDTSQEGSTPPVCADYCASYQRCFGKSGQPSCAETCARSLLIPGCEQARKTISKCLSGLSCDQWKERQRQRATSGVLNLSACVDEDIAEMFSCDVSAEDDSCRRTCANIARCNVSGYDRCLVPCGRTYIRAAFDGNSECFEAQLTLTRCVSNLKCVAIPQLIVDGGSRGTDCSNEARAYARACLKAAELDPTRADLGGAAHAYRGLPLSK